MTLKYMQINTV